MDINSLKLGFKNHLQELNQNSGKDYMVSNSDASIFMYANEFKDYVEDKVNVSMNLFSMSVDDILNMEIKNGQLVDAEDAGLDTFVSTTKNESKETTSTQDEANGEKSNKNFITGLLNSLFKQDKAVATIDTDKNGELNNEEVDSFLNAIKAFDGDANNISYDDIMKSFEEMNNGGLSLAPQTTSQETATKASTTNNSISRGNSSSTKTTGLYSSNQEVSNTNSIGTTNSNSKTTNTNIQKQQSTSLENKSLSQLQAMLPNAQNNVNVAEKELNTAMDAVNNNQYEKAVDAALKNYTNYLEQIQKGNDNYSKLIQNKNTQIENTESKINEIDKEMVNCLTEQSNLETTIKNADSSIKALNETKNSLNSQINSADSNKKSELQAKLSNIEAKIKEEEAKKEAAQDKLNTLENETMPNIEKNKTAEEKNLDNYKKELEGFMKQAEQTYPELSAYKAKYEEAQKTCETQEKALKDKVNVALQNLNTAQVALNELNTAISEAETKETINANSANSNNMTELTQNAVKLAYSQLGVCEDAGENRGEMQKYGGNAGDPWCASFVSWLYGKGQSGNESPIKYTASVSGLRDQAQKAGYYSKVGTYTPVPGDIMIQKSNGASHTGIVVGCDGKYIYTIEGNSSDKVRERKYEIGGNEYQKISGWVRMNEWSGGSNDVDGTIYLANENSEDADETKRRTI